MIQRLRNADALDGKGLRSKRRDCIPANLQDVAKVESVVFAPLVSGWRRVAYLVFAGIFLMLAVLGVALPGLPTTPFLLLTSFFLVRSSHRLHQRLLQSRIFGPLLRDWELRGGVRYGVKIKAIIMVTIAVGLSLWLLQRSVTVSVGVVALASVGIFVIIRVPTIHLNRCSLTGVEKD